MRLEGIIYTYDEGKILRYGQHLTTINYGNKGIVVEAQIRLYWHLYKKTNLPFSSIVDDVIAAYAFEKKSKYYKPIQL